MSELKAAKILSDLESSFSSASEDEKKSQVKQTNAVFQLNIKGKDGKEGVWTIDMKSPTNPGVTSSAAPKPDVTISMDDDTFVGLAEGKIPAQRAFMTGNLKVKGNIMLATKLDGVLKGAKKQSSKL